MVQKRQPDHPPASSPVTPRRPSQNTSGEVRPDTPNAEAAKRGQYEEDDLEESGHGAESYTGSAGFDDAQPSGQYGGDRKGPNT